MPLNIIMTVLKQNAHQWSTIFNWQEGFLVAAVLSGDDCDRPLDDGEKEEEGDEERGNDGGEGEARNHEAQVDQHVAEAALFFFSSGFGSDFWSSGFRKRRFGSCSRNAVPARRYPLRPQVEAGLDGELDGLGGVAVWRVGAHSAFELILGNWGWEWDWEHPGKENFVVVYVLKLAGGARAQERARCGTRDQGIRTIEIWDWKNYHHGYRVVILIKLLHFHTEFINDNAFIVR